MTEVSNDERDELLKFYKIKLHILAKTFKNNFHDKFVNGYSNSNHQA